MERETCGQCGFDAHEWTVRDAAGFFAGLGDWWRMATDGVAVAPLRPRPRPDRWSVLEYGFHSAMATAALRVLAVHRLVSPAAPRPELGFPPAGAEDAPELDLRRADVVDLLGRESEALAAECRQRGPWPEEAAALVLHAVHDASHHLMDVSRQLAATLVPASGRVDRINVSAGGVPKRPVDSAAVGRRGLEGDVQANRKHHGRPFQAVCLWSSDVIAALAGDGHRLFPGAAGENLTLSGIDWPSRTSGDLLHFPGPGGEPGLLVELSWPAVPCHHQAQWFTDGDFRRIAHDEHPGWARWYGWVRRPGTVRPGDDVTVVDAIPAAAL